MKSPFVRFSRFVRTGLSIAAVSISVFAGCRHVPGLRRASEDRCEDAPVVSADQDLPQGSIAYEESNLDAPITPEASESPLVSLSEGDAFQLVPREKPETTSPQPEVAEPSLSPTVTVKESAPATDSTVAQEVPETTIESEVTASPTTEASPQKRELLDSDLDLPRPKKPAPTLKELEDEFFPEPKEPSPKLEIPPEPAPNVEQDSQPTPESKPDPKTKTSTELPTESKADVQPQSSAKELASVESGKATTVIQPAPRKAPVREKGTGPALDNEVVSLDSYCDGLVFDSQGFGYISHKDRIVRFSPTGETAVWTTLNSPKGHRIEPEGTHLVCDTERRAVLRLSFDGKVVAVAAKECDGAALRAPYDIAVDPNGGFYFSDPGYVQIKNPIGKVHYVDRSGNVSVVVAKIGYPTGIAFDAARQRLLVAESMFNRILEFRLSEPGRIKSHEVLVQLPKSPDSEYHLANLCLDADGNLYVTQQQTKAVHVFDPQGRPLGRFSTGAVVPSCVALRSPDAAELFLAGEIESRTRHGKVIRLDLGK